MRPGPPPGTHHAGTFKNGHDPRRNYGPKTSPESRSYYAKARELSPAALDLLWALAQDEDIETKERRMALQFIIEQGHGKAVDRMQISQGNISELPVLSLADLHLRLAPLIDGDDDPDDDHEVPAEEAEFYEVGANDHPV